MTARIPLVLLAVHLLLKIFSEVLELVLTWQRRT
jgi:hypothetical protein